MSLTAKSAAACISRLVYSSVVGGLRDEDYACIATGSSIITSTEVLKDGARCSGPIVSADQRNVFRGKVTIKKDAFIGPHVTASSGVTGGEVRGGAGVTIAKNTDEWGIYVGARAEKISSRAPVKWPDN